MDAVEKQLKCRTHTQECDIAFKNYLACFIWWFRDSVTDEAVAYNIADFCQSLRVRFRMDWSLLHTYSEPQAKKPVR